MITENNNLKQGLMDYMERAKNSGKPAMIVSFIKELPLSEFWEKRFAQNETMMLWKYHGLYEDTDCYVALDMDEKYNYIPFIMVSVKVHDYIIKEIYKIDDLNKVDKI
jgi:hypothetical protein